MEIRCWYCGIELTLLKNRPNTATADHKIPQCRGGSDEPENIVPCCRSCNSRKCAKTVDEYREWIMSDPSWKHGLWEIWNSTFSHLISTFSSIYVPDAFGHQSKWLDAEIALNTMREHIGEMVTVHKFDGEDKLETLDDYSVRIYCESGQSEVDDEAYLAYRASKQNIDEDGDDFSLFMTE